MIDPMVRRLRHRRKELQKRRVPPSFVGVPPETPATPALNQPTAVTADGWDITCTSVSGAQTYEFQINFGSGFVTVQNTASTTLLARSSAENSINESTTYPNRVRAVNGAAEVPDSGWSSVVDVSSQTRSGGTVNVS